MTGKIDVRSFALGDWQTNCYVLHAHAPKALRGSPCWIIDAGFDPSPLIAYIREHALRPTQLILTHAHLDHIAGVEAVRVAYPEVPILIHPDERAFLSDPMLNLSVMIEEPVIAPDATGELVQGQKLELAGVGFEVRHTPGHSPGGISLYQPDDGFVIVGDALFAGSVGRADFPTSNGRQLIESIRTQLLTLPDATKVYPGHGPPTTIGAERAHNPFLKR